VADIRHTSLGCGWWRWKPFIEQPTDARILLLALYSSATAKAAVPGLWAGTLHGMSDDARMSLNETYNALGKLIESKLVIYDEENRLARITQLPDACERAHNDRALRGWWGRFITLSDCPLRNAHVPLLLWLVESGKCSEDMKRAWGETFGTIPVPASVPPFRPPGSSDTGTKVQPSLFAPAVLNSAPDVKNPLISGPAVVSLTTTRPPDPEPDLDQVQDQKGGGLGEGGLSRACRPRLQIVRDPVREPAKGKARAPDKDEAARERREMAAEMKQTVSDLATTLGVPWLVS
jgi:hypothetical protein